MKLVDILLVLSATATTNAILIPTDNNSPSQTSGTSSQVSGPTNEPSPNTSDQNWQNIVIQPGLSISDKYWQYLIDEVGSDTLNDWKELFDIADSNTPKKGQQQSIGQPSPNTYSQGQKRPTDKLDPGTSEEQWQDIMDLINSDTCKKGQQQPVNQPSPSTPKQSRKQPTDKSKSGTTGLNQKTLSTQDQNALDLKEIETSREIREKCQAYYDYVTIGLKQKSALARGEKISEPKHKPEIQNILREECISPNDRIVKARQRLKDLMEKQNQERNRILKTLLKLEDFE
ncbi:hypothetical protein BDEG_27888 [Batrachochytrium dendrobatidis JEL423]|uniref:Uncharacterized protein n=1 Tax=Batrachochytrium dendrobatidis (strain JEL423) TaxID=403673 RepID=A0A177WYT8_BATDL|nr:hypothetical protein BDEG_27888 [Batrachochytrium dendrobatidis JEL423]